MLIWLAIVATLIITLIIIISNITIIIPSVTVWLLIRFISLFNYNNNWAWVMMLTKSKYSESASCTLDGT